MARPRKDDEERRCEFLTVRLTPAERLSLIAEAERLCLSLAELARQRLTKGRVVVQQHRKLDPQQAFELGRIGVNLNQIARALNSQQRLNPATVQGSIDELKELIADLMLEGQSVVLGDSSPAPESEPTQSEAPAPRRPIVPSAVPPRKPLRDP
jgi:hypothetical protein